MALFAFYKFSLKELPDRHLEIPFEKRSEINSYYDVFEKHFIVGKRMPLKKLKHKHDIMVNKDYVEYGNDVLAHRDGIIIMTLENNKHKNTIIEKRKLIHDHHPFCTIIIDYRDGQNLLAIERNNAFDYKPDNVCILLKNMLNRLLAEDSLELSTTPINKTFEDFWDAITTIKNRNKDCIKKICLDFKDKDKNYYPDEDINDAAKVIAVLAAKAEANGFMTLEAEEDSEINIDAIYEDLVNLADICMTQKEYDLTVHFRSYGIYQYGNDVLAQFGIEELAINNFICDADENDLWGSGHDSLERWLDKIYSMFQDQDYETTQPTITTTKRGNRL